MNQRDVEHSLQILEQLMNKGVLQDKEIFLFGMGIPGDRVICCLWNNGYAISGVLDNDIKNAGKTFLGIPVCRPDVFMTRDKSNVIVFTYSKWHSEMQQQLVAFGFDKEQVICLLQEEQFPQETGSFEAALENMDNNWKIYRHYRDKYGEKTGFVIVPISLGDVYICCTLLESFRQVCPDIILMVHGKAGKKVAELFSVEKVLVIPKDHMDALLQMAKVLGRKMTNIYAVPVSFHYSIIDNLLGYKGLHCMDLFRYVMDLPADAPLTVPVVSDGDGIGCLTERDIVLVPYANSLPCFSPLFWEQVADRLHCEGYRVYTNSSNDVTEPVIPGTDRLFLPLEKILFEVNHCGGVIALRCGLCDIISTARCKKIILYPNKGRRFGTLMEYFSLKRMGLCATVTEILFDEEREAEIVDDVVGSFVFKNG